MKTKTQIIEPIKKVTQKQYQFGLIIVFLSLTALHLITRYYIKAEAEESLYSTTYRIEQLLKNNSKPSSLKPLYEVIEVDELKPQILKDTVIYDELQNEDEVFRELNTYISVNGTNYLIVTRSLFADYNDTLISILLAFFIIFVLVYLAQYYYNRQINKSIWLPFFNNLETIKEFSLQSKKPIVLETSNILEFIELNNHIKLLTEKVANDYENLKQFTEDISHEIQTPLSIIQAKIENFIEDSGQLNESQISLLNYIQKNTKRLSKLNQGLILLAKIENQQFNELESIDVNKLIESLLINFEDISSIKDLNIDFSYSDTVHIKMDRTLAEILFSNLIVNAIKYTPNNGQMVISVSSNSFTLSNTGSQPLLDKSRLFNRFYKESKNSHSLGLGLAIVKKICDYYNFPIDYNFKENMHVFSIKFN